MRKRALNFIVPGMLCYALFLFFLPSCNPVKDETTKVKSKRIFPGFHYVLDSVIQSPKGMICGLELGDSKKTIPSVQIKNAGQSEKDHLSYVQKIDSLTKYDILYSLENDTISEIEVLISCQSHDLGDRILNDFKNYYREKYTAPMMDKGYLVFNCFDGRKRNFKISLTDNSSGETSLINLLFYREK